jgi:hypothetical protein
MAGYQGDINLGDTIDIKFTTTSASTGAPTQLAGSPVISAYVGNGTTQITAGITLSVDFDSVTGLNNVRVVASGGNGYAAQTNVSLVITTGTVGGTSAVGYEVGSFSIENRSALRPTTAGRTLDVSAGGEAGIDWANIGSPTTAVNLSSTNIDTDQVVASVTGAVGSVTGAVGSVTGAVGSVTGNVGGNVTGSVGSVAAGGIAAASFAAAAIDAAAIASDAGTEIGTAVWASATRNLTGSQGIKKNTAKAAFLFAMTDATTHEPATGLTVTATRSLDGAAFGACANAVAEVSGGWYKIDLAAGDLNGDTVALKFTATGADQLNISLVTSP